MEKKDPLKNKKILILYAPLGVGHGAAAQAIAEAFALKYPKIEIRNINVLDFVPEVFKKGLPWVYNQTTSKTPILYKIIYNFYKTRSKHLNNLSRIILKKSKFVEFIQEFNPDFIVSTNPLSMQLVSLTKEKKIIDIPSANVCTDYGFYSLWHNKDVNYYFVANEEIKKSLVKYGVKGEKVMVTGIPISSKFSKAINRERIISDLGLDVSKKILLIVGGRISYNNLIKIINGVKKNNKDLQFIIVAGRDKALQEKLNDSEIVNDPATRVFGFVNNLEDYMSSSDLILTKAGGLTVSECLVKNLPMVFNDIIPGQEEDNVNYVARQGAGVKARGVRKSIEVINKLFFHSEKTAEMKRNCVKIAKPSAANDLVDYIVLQIKNNK